MGAPPSPCRSLPFKLVGPGRDRAQSLYAKGLKAKGLKSPNVRLTGKASVMHGLPLLQIVAVAILILANGFFVAAEFALVSMRDTRIEQLIAARVPGASVVRSATWTDSSPRSSLASPSAVSPSAGSGNR
jgi:hypothetical protein